MMVEPSFVVEKTKVLEGIYLRYCQLSNSTNKLTHNVASTLYRKIVTKYEIFLTTIQFQEKVTVK